MSGITGGAVSIHSYERVAKQRAELKKQNAALVAALDSIERYGLDTMSGPMESPPDLAAWYRYGVNEMVRRARTALQAARGES